MARHLVAVVFSLILVLTAASPVTAQGPCPGMWSPAFNHDMTSTEAGWPICIITANGCFNAIHMALIPKGPNRGKVLVWDRSFLPGQGTPPPHWDQRWAVIDPEAVSFGRNHTYRVLGNRGNFFCAGFTWMHDGRLIVFGGTAYSPQFALLGTKLVHIYDPLPLPDGAWSEVTVGGGLAVDRWYATGMLAGDPHDRALGLGGSNAELVTQQDTAFNTYEVYLPLVNQWEAAPQRLLNGPRWQGFPIPIPPDHPLGVFPRMHSLSELAYGGPFSPQQYWMAMSGRWTKSASVDHENAPAVWPSDRHKDRDPLWSTDQGDGTSVLFPGMQDLILYIGGRAHRSGVTDAIPDVNKIDHKKATSDPLFAWAPVTPLNKARNDLNAVILPDASILVLGGRNNQGFVLEPEQYSNGTWTLGPAEASPRGYHSAAMLLPRGRVLSGGGDFRTIDYQVYSPPYLTCDGVVPQFNGYTPDQVIYDQSLTIGYAPLPFPLYVEKVVLIAPSAVTHSFNSQQRYLELRTVPPPPPWPENAIVVRMPANRTYAPRGYYMMFLVTNVGIPSEARWIQLL